MGTSVEGPAELPRIPQTCPRWFDPRGRVIELRRKRIEWKAASITWSV